MDSVSRFAFSIIFWLFILVDFGIITSPFLVELWNRLEFQFVMNLLAVIVLADSLIELWRMRKNEG